MCVRARIHTHKQTYIYSNIFQEISGRNPIKMKFIHHTCT